MTSTPTTEPKTRILLVTPLPPPMGGIARWAQSVMESELASAFDIQAVNTSPPDVESVSGESRFKARRAWASMVTLLRMSGKLVRWRPHIVHINTSYYWAMLRDGLMVRLANRFRARTVLHLHGGDFDRFFRSCHPLYRRFVRRTLLKADRVIAITSETQNFLRAEMDEERVVHLPNFVRTDQFEQPSKDADTRESRNPADPVEVLFVGWMIEAKGVIEILNAALKLPGARFTLAGPSDPDFESRIGDLVKTLGDRISLTGSLPPDEITRLYARSDVFVLPSHREGFPMVIVEAMAAGLPVISTPVGAIPEVVRDGIDGFLVPVGDTAALEDRLNSLVSNATLRIQMGESGRARVHALYAIEHVIQQLSDLYRGLASNPAVARKSVPTPSSM